MSSYETWSWLVVVVGVVVLDSIVVEEVAGVEEIEPLRWTVVVVASGGSGGGRGGRG